MPALLSVISVVESVLETCKKTKWSWRPTTHGADWSFLENHNCEQEQKAFWWFFYKNCREDWRQSHTIEEIWQTVDYSNISRAVEKLSTSFHTERITALLTLQNSLAWPYPLCQSGNRCLFEIMKLDLVKACTQTRIGKKLDLQ